MTRWMAYRRNGDQGILHARDRQHAIQMALEAFPDHLAAIWEYPDGDGANGIIVYDSVFDQIPEIPY